MQLNTNTTALQKHVSDLIKRKQFAEADRLFEDTIKAFSSLTNELKFKFSVWLINNSIYGNYQQALIYLNELISFDSSDCKVILLKAFTEDKYQGTIAEDTIQLIQKLTQIRNDGDGYCKHLLYLLALYYKEKRDFVKFYYFLSQSLIENYGSVVNQRLMAQYCLETNNLENAKLHFKKALENVTQVVDNIPPTDWSDFNVLLDEYFNGNVMFRNKYKLLVTEYESSFL